MDTWAVFWICWFGYLAIKYTVNALTYDKRQALKDVVREESKEDISKMVNEMIDSLDLDDIHLTNLVKSLKKDKK